MEKTIAAISTGLAPSGICIVRMSGEKAVEIGDSVFRSGVKKSFRLEKVKTHTIHFGYINDGSRDLDEVLVSVMRAPRTYTGEDIVEINCHGGTLAAKKILELLLKRGASVPEPGEFTKRAFLNGRMDLAKAEAVIDVIDAKNDFALKAGVSQLRGDVSEKVRAMREEILDQVSFIEAALDDPEHYDLTGFGAELAPRAYALSEELNEMVKRADYGSVLKEGIQTVIAGRPNAGKSSLFNLLAGQEKAIVTEIAGTTRDVLESQVVIGDISLNLNDTAGIRETTDTVEKIGVDRARTALSGADLVLYLIDACAGLTSEDEKELSEIEGHPLIIILNKTDLVSDDEVEKMAEMLDSSKYHPSAVIPFSVSCGKGLAELTDKIIAMFDEGNVLFNDQVVITNARHKELLREAAESVKLAAEGAEMETSEEFLTIDLMNAYTALGKIIGEEVGDDVIQRVFEKFCMGK